MAELLKELKKGMASFTMIGNVKIATDTFKGVIQPKDGKYWASVKTGIPIEIEEGVRIYPEINDGYMTNNLVLKRFPAEKSEDGGMLDIPFKNRLDEKMIEKVAPYTLYRTNIEKDEDGKPIMKTFIHGLDFENYLKEHLKNDMEVRIQGDVEYSFSKDREKEYRNYKVKGVFLNEGYKKNDEVFEPLPHSATMRQTYFVEAGALADRWEKDLEGKGKTTVSAFVPTYMSKIWDGKKYAEFKETVAVPQSINILVADPSDEKSLARAKVLAKKLFDVPKKKVRQVNLVVKINEGFETGTPDIEVDADLQALIDEGLMDIEDITKQVTVRGERVSELILVKPNVKINEEGKTVIDIEDDKFSPDVLIFPEIPNAEDDEDDFSGSGSSSSSEEKVEDPAEGMGDAEFDALFN